MHKRQFIRFLEASRAFNNLVAKTLEAKQQKALLSPEVYMISLEQE